MDPIVENESKHDPRREAQRRGSAIVSTKIVEGYQRALTEVTMP